VIGVLVRAGAVSSEVRFTANSSSDAQHRVMRTVLAFAALLFCDVAAADSMRCGSRIIQDGDLISTVRDLCGEPSDIQTRSILRRPSYQLNGRQYFFADELTEVPVDIWTYNFGPYKLMRRIRFVDGVVEEIETLGYGYNR
jgi:hypothetical protein